MKKIRLYIAAMLATLTATVGIMAFATPANALFESAKDQACNGANLQDSGGCDSSNDTSGQVTSTLKAVINILSLIVGIVAVIMIIIGGIRFITSQGEGSSTALARNTIIYALVGIVVASIAQVMVHFVIGRATKSNLSSTVDTSSKPGSVKNADGSTTVTTKDAQGGITKVRTYPNGDTTTTKPNGQTTTCTSGRCVTRE